MEAAGSNAEPVRPPLRFFKAELLQFVLSRFDIEDIADAEFVVVVFAGRCRG